ncbi:hypothetical protein GALMADRAFT_140195 [Galerina marginata CBS 339.88]|uniref:Hydrophobin n=1 Tax=Galerina marginata (strain CBS 339.88) TaxID=685588 RepID=A0A067TAI1_GALM3|nr:hypothetical protein GALMADRAFT_140195 [Galerina marginata CBS 339.88]
MRASAVFALALPVLAAATAIPRDGDCNTGSIQCCNQIQSSTSQTVAQLAGLLGIDLGSLGALVGLSCSPISVLGVGGNSCSQQPVCCTGNTFGGLLALGCNPINLNL